MSGQTSPVSRNAGGAFHLRGADAPDVGRPIRAAKTGADWYGTEWSDGETQGREVYDDGSWSDAQPTGLLTADGNMLYRVANSIGFLADN